MQIHRTVILSSLLVLMATALNAQDRDTKVRQDRDKIAGDEKWFYNDLENGIVRAREQNKPLLVVLRCIP